jgi:hypothetical protein
MSWIRLTDTFPEDDKVDGLSDRAFRMFVTGLCYCGRNLTDGYLTTKAISTVAASSGVPKRSISTVVSELETVGLWHRYAHGYWTPKYLDYNPSAEQVRADRAKAKSRMQRIRSGERSGEHQGELTGSFGRSSGEQGESVRAKFCDPDPTRPDPSSGSSTVSNPSSVPVVPEREGGDFEPEHPENLPPELASRIETATRSWPA